MKNNTDKNEFGDVNWVYSELRKEFDNSLKSIEEDMKEMYEKFLFSVSSEMESDKKRIRSKLESEVEEWRCKYNESVNLCIFSEDLSEEKDERIDELQALLESKTRELENVTGENRNSSDNNREEEYKERKINFEKKLNERDVRIVDLTRMNENLGRKIEKLNEKEQLLSSMNSDLSEKIKRLESEILKKEEEMTRKEKEWDIGRILLEKKHEDTLQALSTREEELVRNKTDGNRMKYNLHRMETELKLFQNLRLKERETENEKIIEQKRDMIERFEAEMKLKEVDIRRQVKTEKKDLERKHEKEIEILQTSFQEQLNEIKVKELGGKMIMKSKKELVSKEKIEEKGKEKQKIGSELAQLKPKLNDEKGEMLKTISRKNQELASRNNELERCSSEISQNEARILELTRNHNIVSEEKKKIENELKNRDLKIREYKSRLDEIVIRNNQLQEESKSLKEKYEESVKKNVEQLNNDQQLESLRHEIQTLRSEMAQKDETIASLGKEVESSRLNGSTPFGLSPIKKNPNLENHEISVDGIDLEENSSKSGKYINKTLQPGDYIRMMNKRNIDQQQKPPPSVLLSRKIVRGRPKLRRSLSFVSKNPPPNIRRKNSPKIEKPKWKNEEEEEEEEGEDIIDNHLKTKTITTNKRKILLRRNLDPNEIPLKKSKILREYFDLDSHFGVIPRSECSIARDPENLKKNRYRDILPYDRTLVRLGGGKSKKSKNWNYINASHVDVNGVRYIAAQWPLDDPSKGIYTEGEWWSMIFEKDISVVLSLQRPGPPKHTYYYPKKENAVKNCGNYSIVNEGNSVTTSYREVKCTICERKKMKKYLQMKKKNLKMWRKKKKKQQQQQVLKKKSSSISSETDQNQVDLDSEGEENDTSFLIDGVNYKSLTVITYMIWPDMGLPKDTETLKGLMERIDNLSQRHEDEKDKYRNCNGTGRSPILVHCSAGVGRTGVFMVCHSLLRKHKENWKEGSIFEIKDTLRKIREQRNHCVQNIEQYEYCYTFIWKYY